MFETEINVKLQKQQELYLETKKIAENQIQPEIDRVDAEIRVEIRNTIGKEEYVVAEKYTYVKWMKRGTGNIGWTPNY